MCPQVNSAEAGRGVGVGAALGPPGWRGIALFHRGARFGTDPDAIGTRARADTGDRPDRVAEAVEAVEEIAAVDGIDVLFVGPCDLSYSMGLFREFDDPEFRAAIERVVAAARRGQDGRDLPDASPDQVAAGAGGRVPDDRDRLRRRLHDAGRALRPSRRRRRRRLARSAERRGERGAHRLGAEIAERPQQAAHSASGSRSSSRIHSASSRDSTKYVSASRQAFRRRGRITSVLMPGHSRRSPSSSVSAVSSRSSSTSSSGHVRGAEALARDRLDRMGRGGDLLVAEIEARQARRLRRRDPAWCRCERCACSSYGIGPGAGGTSCSYPLGESP